MYRTLLFDLDGTLTDSGPGIMNSVAYAIRKFGLEVPETAILKKFIGPPLADSFQEYCGLSQADAERGILYYREYFTAGGMFENSVYPGIPELLTELKARGRKLIIATSKPIEFTLTILKHFGLNAYFDYTAGASMDESLCRKEDIIALALRESGTKNLSECVMIGDREHDITGGRKNGLKTIGVLYGYGSRTELETAGADHLAARPADILKLID